MSALGKGDKKPLFIGTDGFPEMEVFFGTEELYPQSKVVNEVRIRTVRSRGNGIPFAQAVHPCSIAHYPFLSDSYVELDGLLTVATYRGDCTLSAYPIHDGNRKGSACSHSIQRLLAS